jgi:class 3 adenylate cyclase
MNILNSYAADIRNAVLKSRQGYADNFTGYDGRELKKAAAIGSVRNFSGDKNLLTLDGITSPYDASNAVVGEHPDFCHLKGTDQTEKHYVVSVFMDMKGSTQMNDVYDLDTLHYITNTVQRAAIHLCLALGGHIQRLMGDAVFVYFGGRNMTKIDAVKQALTATSLFSYYIKNDIAEIFEEDGVENISTRTGIDFGDDNDVLWGTFGSGGCIELTTQSLHTSLACHCQSNAPKNGIVVGDNVKVRAVLEESFYECMRKPDGNIDYVYVGRRKGIYYKQYVFDWMAYLKSLPFIGVASDGKLYVRSAADQEQARIDRLRQMASVVQAGNAYTNTKGQLTTEPTAIQNQPHLFHYVEPISSKRKTF